MFQINAKKALLSDGWAKNVLVEISNEGKISKVIKDYKLSHGMNVGILLPSPVNVHSHSFQRAIAGLTENKGIYDKDSFWTWRELMFKFLKHLNPDDIESISTLVQMQMLEAGFSSVVEFHYLHHQPNGQPYNNLSELSERIISSSENWLLMAGAPGGSKPVLLPSSTKAELLRFYQPSLGANIIYTEL